MTIKELFDFITDKTINVENMEDCLERISDRIANRNFDEMSEQEKIDEEVFKSSYIPKTLSDVYDIERDIFGKKTAEAEVDKDLIYATVTGLDEDLKVAEKPKVLGEVESEDGSQSESDEEDENEADEEKGKSKGRNKEETTDEKRARKKAIRDEKAAKRETKIPKHVKKRKEKMSTKKK